ncbi:MAG: hypothetical protein GX935_02890 [Erysipelotrichia bacterium]|nr:hypothetical protein [Erysipelotrichia bacterium]
MIEAFDGQLLVTIDEQVYSLDKLELHEKQSKDFDYDPVIKTNKKIYIPPMSHPWKMKSFLKQQERAHLKKRFT